MAHSKTINVHDLGDIVLVGNNMGRGVLDLPVDCGNGAHQLRIKIIYQPALHAQ